MGDFVCRKCGGNANEIDGYLNRVTPLGEMNPDWECVPDCDLLGFAAPVPTATRGGVVSLVGFSARNHPQQTGKRGPRPDGDHRATPPELFDPLDARFGFTLDVCALPENAKCARYLTPEQDGLQQSWAGEVVWCNPPYSNIGPWVEKASVEARQSSAIVMLVPANRCEQWWWQDHIEPHRDRDGSPLRVEFLRGRRRFIGSGKDGIGPNERPPFGVALLIWHPAPLLPEEGTDNGC